MAGLFLFLYRLFKQHRIAFFTAAFAIALLAAYTGSKIDLEEDISKAMPADEKTEKLNQVFQNSRFLDKLIVHLTLENKENGQELLAEFADSLIDRLKNNYSPRYIREITGVTPEDFIREVYDSLYQNLPAYLDAGDYLKLDEMLSDSAIDKTLKKNYRTLISPVSMVMKQSLLRDPLSITPLVLKKLVSFQFDENFEISNGYIFTKDRKHLIFFITPAASSRETAQNTLLIEAIDKTISSEEQAFGGKLKAGYFGTVAVAVANATRIKKDIQLTVTLSVVMLMLYLGFYFRRISILFVIFLPLVFGGLISLAVLALIKTKVSVIALGIGGILLGITIDYSLHVLNHFRHTGNAKTVIRELAGPLMLSCLITASDFLCLLFVKSGALRDLGLFAAISVINAALVALTILPQLLNAKSLPAEADHHSKKLSLLDKFFHYPLDKNRILIAIIVIFSIFSAFILDQVSFESDMMKINFPGKELQESENELNKISNISQKSVFLISSGNNLDHALSINEKLLPVLEALKKRNVIKKYSSVSTLLMSDSLQKSRIRTWNNYWTTDKKAALKEKLVESGSKYKFRENAFDDFFALLDKDFTSLGINNNEKIKNTFLHDYISSDSSHTTVVTLLKVEDAARPEIYRTFEGMDNLVILDKQYLTSRFVDVLKNDFTLLANLSFFLVLIILIASYGRWELGLIAFMPMILAWVWILGIMVLTGIKFNIINIIISTFICGLGIDYSIFIMSGLLHEYKYGVAVLPSYKKSIFLSASTTIIGVSALILAKHPALQSIAVLSVIGMLCVVLMSYTVEPFLFRHLVLNRKAKGKLPWTFLTLFLSAFAFIHFFAGCILLTTIGLVLHFLPFPVKNKKYIFHFILSVFTGSIIYIMINVRKKIINPHRENFKKPAVIIANHQSFLDILLLTMINPKMILLTNDWVYNSPVFGRVVKFADFYPVSSGFENSIELLREKVNDGYSIVIYPEGTRSATGKIGRFHKGAFYIAEKLNIDILPLLLHGTGDAMSKGDDFMLKNGRLTLKYLGRITPDDIRFGKNYAERTRLISRYFKSELEVLRRERETPEYFTDRLIKNYIYKGPVLEWYLRIKLRLENNYRLFNDLVPLAGKITDIGCGYGFMSYMLGFLSEERKITGIDYDEDKINVANQGVSKTEQFRFLQGDITQMDFETADAFVISDVLHYFPPEDQKKLVRKCFSSLEEGGVIIIRDGNAELKKRHQGTRLSEFFSTRFGFNKTNFKRLFFFTREDMIENLKGLDVTYEIIDNTRLTSNIIFVIRKNKKAREHAGV
jgi:1-acyl-sn-glycerol-3-phosphate acyltransferase